MKKKTLMLLCLPLLITMVTSCGDTSSSVTSTAAPTTTTPIPYAAISSIRNAEVGDKITIEGVVVKHVYTGQTTPYITGFYIADETGCIYIYGEDTAKSVSVGNKLILEGEKAYYIPETDSGAAAAENYKGAVQLKNPNVLRNDKGNNEWPKTSVQTANNLSEILEVPLNQDITGNIYQVKGRIAKVPGSGYTNYYIRDFNRVDSIAFYTQSNGKDYAWLDEYDTLAVEMYCVVQNAKPGTKLWRFCPISVIAETTVTDEQEVNYGLARTISEIKTVYRENVTIELKTKDEALEGITYSYSSTSEALTISTQEDKVMMAIDTSLGTSAKLTITATYKKVTKSQEITITFDKAPEVETTDISLARTMINQEVTIDGVIARMAYKSGSSDPLGAFIVDETGVMFVYHYQLFNGATEGNRVIVKGKVVHYVSNAGNAEANGYVGDLQMTDAEIIYNNNDVMDFDKTSIQENTIANIVATSGTTNLSGSIFLIKNAIIKKSVSTYATTYNIYDANNEEVFVNFYSQKQGAEYAWVDEYIDQTVDVYLGIQNAKYSSSTLTWRGCPISIVTK